MVLKSIEHLTLDHANPGKIDQLELLSTAYHQFLQEVIDYCLNHDLVHLCFVPQFPTESPLSERYKQTAGLQAVRVVKSYWKKIQVIGSRKERMVDGF